MKHGGDIYSDQIEYDFSVNLNPLDTDEIEKAILEECAGKLRYYPDPEQREFREALADVEGIACDEVIGGNGASELLLALVTMLSPRKAMLLNPCFSGYRHVLASLPDVELVEYGLEEEKAFLPDEDFLKALEREAKGGLELLFLTNPNNPTGRNISGAILEQTLEFCKKCDVKLIVDECFLRMSDAGHSMVPRIREYEGLFVLSAYTKLFSIPGVRLGYMISAAPNIEHMKTYLPEWNMSVIAQIAGTFCSKYLRLSNWEDETKRVIKKERAYLHKELTSLGLRVYDSDAGFLLLYSEEDLYDSLKNQGILIRDCADYQGLKEGFYRIAVKNHKANEQLIQTLKVIKDK